MGEKNLDKVAIAIFAILTLAPGDAAANVFRYMDRDGRVHSVVTGKARRTKANEKASSVVDKGEAPYPYAEHVREAAELYALPEELLLAVMKVESSFDARAISSAGAMGLMQLMPRTAAELGVTNPFEPRQNILGGARYLRILVNRFDGDLAVAIGAYHAGFGAILRNGRVPPTLETRRYVAKVLRYYRHYSLEGFRNVEPLIPRRR